MRNFIDLLAEKYSSDNADLLRYLKNDDPDPYGLWWAICNWLDENDYLDEVAQQIGEELPDMDALHEMDAEVFFKLEADLQRDALQGAKDWMYQHDAANAPTKMHVDLRGDKLLPRTTWLIHFSDEAERIADEGFTHGVSDIDRLGLTTHLHPNEKAYGGYNFAFRAGDRMAEAAAKSKKYGKHAVMFQNSGVHTFHIGDAENQIIFWGADVDPKSIVFLRYYGDDWAVQARRNIKSGTNILYRGGFQTYDDATRAARAHRGIRNDDDNPVGVVNWVIQNYHQYRRYL
jgi:hypothetical protein